MREGYLKPGKKRAFINEALYKEFGLSAPSLQFTLKKKIKKYIVLQDSLPVGHRILNSNYTIKEEFSDGLNDKIESQTLNYLQESPLGATVIKPLKRDTAITQRDVIFRFDIKRGKRITLKYIKSGLHIESVVYAAEPGIIGRKIKLQRRPNKAVIYATLVNKNEAEFITNEEK